MKTIWKLFMFLLTATIALVSCEEDSLDPLTGKYSPPEVYDLTVLETQDRVKDGPLYSFSVNLTDGASNTLSMKLFSTDYILPASDFTPSNQAANKTYLLGANGTTFNGQQILDGTISIAAQDSNYTVSGILYLADETVLKLSGAFTYAYQPDPYIPTYTYTDETVSPAMGGAQGATPIDGSTMHKITVYADDVFYAYLELVTDASATSLSGTYAVKDGVNAIGQLANGYYVDLAWYGMAGVMEGGSFYMKGEEKMFIREGEGVLTITDNGGVLTITGENLAILDLEALKASNGATWSNLQTPGSMSLTDVSSAETGDGDATVLASVFAASATDLSAYGGTGYTVTLKMATSGLTATYNEATWGYDFAGTGNYISLDFNRDSPTLVAGTYNVVSNETAAVGDCIAGYPNPYGEGTWGSVWSTVTDGAAADVAVTGGTVTVVVDEDTYTITANVTTDQGDVKASYTGAVVVQ